MEAISYKIPGVPLYVNHVVEYDLNTDEGESEILIGGKVGVSVVSTGQSMCPFELKRIDLEVLKEILNIVSSLDLENLTEMCGVIKIGGVLSFTFDTEECAVIKQDGFLELTDEDSLGYFLNEIVQLAKKNESLFFNNEQMKNLLNGKHSFVRVVDGVDGYEYVKRTEKGFLFKKGEDEKEVLPLYELGQELLVREGFVKVVRFNEKAEDAWEEFYYRADDNYPYNKESLVWTSHTKLPLENIRFVVSIADIEPRRLIADSFTEEEKSKWDGRVGEGYKVEDEPYVLVYRLDVQKQKINLTKHLVKNGIEV